MGPYERANDEKTEYCNYDVMKPPNTFNIPGSRVRGLWLGLG